MKTLLSLSVIAWAFVLGPLAAAQQGQSSGIVVVLDVAKVFKENTYFNQQIAAIQAKAQQLKTEVETRQQKLRVDAQAVSEQFKPNTPERQNKEAELEQQMTSLRTYARQAETELMNQEAQLYYDTYQKMQKIVASAAEANGIALVLRFDSAEIEPTNRADVIRGVNKPVVFQSNSDITGWVIEQMSPTQAANPSATQNK